MINAINHSDGLDGLAGGESILSLCAIAYLAYLADGTTTVIIALAIIGGLLGFIRFNTHPATIFMGDSGSQFLGFARLIARARFRARRCYTLGKRALDSRKTRARCLPHQRAAPGAPGHGPGHCEGCRSSADSQQKMARTSAVSAIAASAPGALRSNRPLATHAPQWAAGCLPARGPPISF